MPDRRGLTAWLTAALLAGTATAADPIAFPQKNVSDARGLLNVFRAFRAACLAQPVRPGLAEALRPEGYRVVPRAYHLGVSDEATVTGTAILSATGREETDRDQGHPIIALTPASDAAPHGACQVSWRRGWDYDEGQARIALEMFGAMPQLVSYHLEAYLVSRPDVAFAPDKPTPTLRQWVTWCWEGRLCSLAVLHDFHPGRGIEISITREEVSQ